MDAGRNGSGTTTIFLNQYNDVTVSNNIFIGCVNPPLIVNKFWGRWDEERIGLFKQLLKAVNYRQPPWSERYPSLANFDFAVESRGKGNVSEKNLFVNCVRPTPRNAVRLPLTERNNRAIDGDPGFVDMAGRNFALKPGVDVGIPGFEPIPFDKIGLKRN